MPYLESCFIGRFMQLLGKINTTLNTNDKIPTSTTYSVPSPDINSPPTAVPIVVPKLTDDKNSPFAKSGAFGAADEIQY